MKGRHACKFDSYCGRGDIWGHWGTGSSGLVRIIGPQACSALYCKQKSVNVLIYVQSTIYIYLLFCDACSIIGHILSSFGAAKNMLAFALSLLLLESFPTFFGGFKMVFLQYLCWSGCKALLSSSVQGRRGRRREANIGHSGECIAILMVTSKTSQKKFSMKQFYHFCACLFGSSFFCSLYFTF